MLESPHGSKVTKQVPGQWRIKPKEYQNYLEKRTLEESQFQPFSTIESFPSFFHGFSRDIRFANPERGRVKLLHLQNKLCKLMRGVSCSSNNRRAEEETAKTGLKTECCSQLNFVYSCQQRI